MKTWFCENGDCGLGCACPHYNESAEFCWIERSLRLADRLRDIVPIAVDLANHIEALRLATLDDLVEDLRSLYLISLDSDKPHVKERYLEIYKQKTGKDWEG